MPASDSHGQELTWSPQRPRYKLVHVLVSWLVAGVAVFVAAAIVPHVSVGSFADALAAAVLIAALNAVLPPVIAALRLPFTLALGFVIVLVLDAFMLLLASHITTRTIRVDSFGWALLASVVISATMLVLEVIFGVNDDDTYSLRVIRRIARRQGGTVRTDTPGILFLEIDGLARPVLQRAIRDGNAPQMASWLELGTHRLDEWEPDLSSQTGASQAGILLGSNEDIPAFRWVEKASGKVMTCSSPDDCAEIERRLANGNGLLTHDGASRGNLFSGEADAMILTVSRMGAEKKANPGYRAFLANGFNVTRLLVLFLWEAVIEKVSAIRQRRRKVWPRGYRGGRYPFLRAALCVGVRDLIVFGVLTDMMRGRPAVYATFSSYDEVAHHSGLERPDTLEALRKLDQQFGRIERARRFAPRPYETGRALRPRTDPGGDVQAAQRLRPRGVRRALDRKREGHAPGDRRRERRGGRARGRRGHRARRRRRRCRRRRERRDRARLGQSRADLPDGRAPPPVSRGDRRAPSATARAPAPASAHRIPARPLTRARRGRARRARQPGIWPTTRSSARIRWRHSRPGAAATCDGPTGSSMSPTSWSTASTTPTSSRAARSRS